MGGYYNKVDPELARQHHVAAAKARWIKRRPALRLKADLKLLHSVIGTIRRHLEVQARAPEVQERAKAASRKSSLAAYYKKRDAYNEARRKNKDSVENRRTALFRSCAKVAQIFYDRQSSLASALRRHDAKAPQRILRKHLRRRYEKAIRGLPTPGSISEVAQEIVGCTLTELRLHLEARFLPGMTWENYGFYGWHIDHVIPIAKFDLTDPEQVRTAFHFKNLQPLWWKDNLKKGKAQFVRKTGQSLLQA